MGCILNRFPLLRPDMCHFLKIFNRKYQNRDANSIESYVEKNTDNQILNFSSFFNMYMWTLSKKKERERSTIFYISWFVLLRMIIVKFLLSRSRTRPFFLSFITSEVMAEKVSKCTKKKHRHDSCHTSDSRKTTEEMCYYSHHNIHWIHSIISIP